MSATTLAKSMMRFGAGFGMAAVVLVVLGPLVNRNFGVGDSLSFMPLPAVWAEAPGAVLVSLIYLVVLVISVVLSAMLITTAMVIRHAEASEPSEQTAMYTDPI